MSETREELLLKNLIYWGNETRRAIHTGLDLRIQHDNGTWEENKEEIEETWNKTHAALCQLGYALQMFEKEHGKGKSVDLFSPIIQNEEE